MVRKTFMGTLIVLFTFISLFLCSSCSSEEDNKKNAEKFYQLGLKAYSGRNPKAGKKVKIKSKKLPYFKCGKELKEGVDYQ